MLFYRFGRSDRSNIRGGMGGGRFNNGRDFSMNGMQRGERLRKPNWNIEELPPFEKNFYKELPSVTNRSPVSA